MSQQACDTFRQRKMRARRPEGHLNALGALKGELAGKSAIDLKGPGKGRCAKRIIYSENPDGSVSVHDIVDYHK